MKRKAFRWLATLAVAVAGWLLAMGGEPVELRSIAKGGVSGITEARRVVVKDGIEWAKLWAAHRVNARGDTKPPEIDFTREMAVFVEMGQQRTGGYSVEIVKVVPADKTLKIFVKSKSPPKGAMVTQALTASFHIVAVPRSELTPEFLEAEESAKR